MDQPVLEERGEDVLASARRGRLRGPAIALLLFVVGLVAWAWFSREGIADRFIGNELEKLGVPATYEVVSIGPRRQVLRNVVVGDPARPDLTAERAEVVLKTGWGGPRFGRLTLVRPRLFGTYRGGKLSFGSLDKVLFRETGRKPRLPDLDVDVRDGRARLDTDFGPAGVKLDGKGHLRGGFSGMLAAVAPRAEAGGCSAEQATVFGRLSISDEKPRFAGPLRARQLKCAGLSLAIGPSDVRADVTADRGFGGAEGRMAVKASRIAYKSNRIDGTGGSVRFVWRKRGLTANYNLAGRNFVSPQAALASLSANGVLRTASGFDRIDLEGALAGEGLRPGSGLDAALGRAVRVGEGTLLAPIFGQIRAGLQREGQRSALTASYVLRRTGKVLNVVLPQARVVGGSGETLIDVSRLQFTDGDTMTPRLVGNFSTGGQGIPRIAGRVERVAGGRLLAQLSMAEYRAGTARLALPQLALVQEANGTLGFAGRMQLSGDVPGGHAEDLSVPLDGAWTSRGGFVLWRRCTLLRFEQLTLADLRLDRRALTLCPPPGSAIVRSGPGGLRIAAGAPALDVSGRLGQTPIRLSSGAFGIAWPGALTARRLDVALGPPATASRFRIGDLTAQIGKDIAGRFGGADIKLFSVPLDLREAQGDWRYAGGRLTIGGGQFTLVDRQGDPRFAPLVSRDGRLALAANIITAQATMREPRTDREVVRVDLHHNLANGRGRADLDVPGVLFDQQVQPGTLSRLALGVVANARGTVRGTGRIDWNRAAVTSSGRFASDSIDFAAPFGPVKGASGEVVFTDLLGFVTAPNQRIRVASINPGIEVADGEVVFQLKPGSILELGGGTWPFLGGTLTIQPVRMRLGVTEVRRYVLVIKGLDAAKFVERMDLGNISATGTFDGTLPLVFDANGGRIEGGLLEARPPGGNVSYVGELTYKDLSPMANFAFDALKSLDYQRMTIGMDGALQGEIVTRVRFDQVKQGATAKRNFITKRFAKLPIQFNLNLRAPFYRLITTMKSLYDPAYVRDPRDIGLLDAGGRPIRQQAVNPKLPEIRPQDIQPPDSE